MRGDDGLMQRARELPRCTTDRAINRGTVCSPRNALTPGGDAIEAASQTRRIASWASRSTVEGDHDRVRRGRDLGRVLIDEQARGHQRDANAGATAAGSQSAHRVQCQERLAAGQHDALDVKRADRGDMAFRDRPREISRLSALAFQMSHITHRQLQALCTLSARIGSD